MSSKRPALRLLSLCSATFFIVSGGPYGLEEVIQGHGFGRALALLALLPLVWALPVALMVGELGSALPHEGGYYAWVKRGMGPFWGALEAWLSLATSAFDMAIYPTLFVTYLAGFWPALEGMDAPGPGWLAGLAMIAGCVVWNLRGVAAVGAGSTWMGAALLLPFAGMAALAVVRPGAAGEVAVGLGAPAGGGASFVAGLLLCMWNYMGWDNASTVAAEVDEPQRTYPRAMLGTLALVALCYGGAVLAGASSGLPASEWKTGAWVEAARRLGGPWLAGAVVLGGAVSACGMFNALLMSMARLPLSLAEDGLLPAWVGRRTRGGAPVAAVIASAAVYALTLGLGLRRLVELDVALYGAALVLEFVALVALRVREPGLARPFKVPGGTVAAGLLGVPPTALLLLSLWAGRAEPGVFGLTALQVAGLLVVAGVLWSRRVAARLS